MATEDGYGPQLVRQSSQQNFSPDAETRQYDSNINLQIINNITNYIEPSNILGSTLNPISIPMQARPFEKDMSRQHI